jgi:hypothetical protein
MIDMMQLNFGIRESSQTQLKYVLYFIMYSFIKATCFDPLKGSSSVRGWSIYKIIRHMPTWWDPVWYCLQSKLWKNGTCCLSSSGQSWTVIDSIELYVANNSIKLIVFCFSSLLSHGEDSSVYIVTGYGLDNLGFEPGWRQEIFTISISVQTSPGAHTSSSTVGNKALSKG